MSLFHFLLRNLRNGLFDVPAEIVSVGTLHTHPNEIDVRIPLAVRTLKGLKMQVWLVDSPSKFLQLSSPRHNIVNRTDDDLRTSHTKRQHKLFILVSLVQKANEVPTGPSKLAVKGLIVISCYHDRALQ